MSDCGCKNDKKISQKNLDKAAFSDSLGMRIFLFLISVAIVGITLIPVILPLILIMLFNQIVRKKTTNVQGTLLGIGKLFKRKKEEVFDNYEDDDDNEINPDDYELTNVDVIK